MTETVELVDQPVVASAAAEPAPPSPLPGGGLGGDRGGNPLHRRDGFLRRILRAGTAGITGTAMGMGALGEATSMQGGFGGPGMMPPWGPGWARAWADGSGWSRWRSWRGALNAGNPAGPSTTVPSRP